MLEVIERIDPRTLCWSEPEITNVDWRAYTNAIAKTGLLYHRNATTASGRMRYVLGEMPNEKGEHILEIGCSSGRTTIELLRTYNSKVVAIEIGPDIARRAIQNLEEFGDRVEIVVGDGYYPYETLGKK